MSYAGFQVSKYSMGSREVLASTPVTFPPCAALTLAVAASGQKSAVHLYAGRDVVSSKLYGAY